MKRTKENLTGRYTAIAMLYWADYSIIQGYASVYLLGSGFSNTFVGMLISASAIGATLLQPVVAARTDRRGGRAVQKALAVQIIISLIALTTLVTLTYAGKGTAGEGHGAGRLAVVAVLYGTAFLILQVMTPFINALATLAAKCGKEVDFGFARGIGSGAYSVASFLCGSAAGSAGFPVIPIIAIPVQILMLVMVCRFPDSGVPGREKEENRETSSEFFRRYPSFSTVLLGTLMILTCHMMINLYEFQIVQSKGGGNAELGIGLSIAALTEIPVMILLGRMRSRIHPGRLIVLGGAVYSLRAVGYILLPGVFGFYAMQFLQILSWAVLGVVTVYYVTDAVLPEDEVKGQAYFTMAMSLGTVLASFFGGILIDAAGINVMLAVAFAAGISGTLVAVKGVRGKR